MFQASAAFAFFDYFRVPYTVSGGGGPGAPYQSMRLTGAGEFGTGGPELAWPDSAGEFGGYRLGRTPIFARMVGDRATDQVRSDWGSGWQPIESIVDAAGRPVASVWRDAGGNVLLPFDPGEVMWRFFSEHYQDAARGAGLRALLVRAYYVARPLIPRPVQIALRRAFTRVQEHASFPAFPVEPALHDFYEWLFQLVAEFAGGPVPWLSRWPHGHEWALVLTHDVETAAGLAALDTLRDIERATGHRSSWNFVPQRYPTPDPIIAQLTAEGCEIGVHGLRHDGRDLGSLRLLRRRLPAIKRYARRWGAVGFRSPATQRTWELMPLLGFGYDSSYHDTAPYEPQPGGSCSYLPYFVGSPGRPGDMVELPITLPMDHTLFAVLQQSDATIWWDKAAHVRDRGGMVLTLTHPDYAHDNRVTDGYRRLLEAYRADPTVWRALPREVAAWWQRRAVSWLERTEAGWVVRGPAAEQGEVCTCWPGVPALHRTV